MSAVVVESLIQASVEDQKVELVERKGLGHPDSICDALADEGSIALCQEYKRVCGRVLHHNLDKAMLVAGTSSPKVGGGTVEKPMKLILGDRATFKHEGRFIDVPEIVIQAAKDWIRSHLKWVDPERHVVYQSEIKPGSPELVGLFDQNAMTVGILDRCGAQDELPGAPTLSPPPGANDTSAAVGFAPLTKTEEMVLSVERYLNSERFKQLFPGTGEDIKIMGFRQGRRVRLTVAIAFVDCFVPSAKAYFENKKNIREHLQNYLKSFQNDFESIQIDINTLDNPLGGESGMYLTVLGLSAEGADSGQVGRGNRANGLISLNRPQGVEAHAGKNPINHVGKIYSHLAHYVAGRIYNQVGGIREVYVYFCSQIGRPISDPLIASVKVLLDSKTGLDSIKAPIETIVRNELRQINDFTAKLSSPASLTAINFSRSASSS